jgi:hypothetical protein
MRAVRYNVSMTAARPPSYIVKATSATGLEMWISLPRAGGHRVFGPREKAGNFKTQSEAQAAIGTLPLSFEHAGFKFSVEAAE